MYAYTRIEYEYEMMNEMIENEMYKVRDNALRKLSSFFVHQHSSIKDIALTLAYGWFDSYTPAQNIANSLDLSKLDFLAIQEGFEAFKEEYLKNYEEAQNF
jgi:hypothetical protein